MSSQETIFALSSPWGVGGVAVIRVSGPQALSVLKQLTGGRDPVMRRAVPLILRDPADGHLLDHALTIAFKGPASFTGEDVVEYHVHGGRAVVADMLRVLSACEGYRLAEAGEFTRRAFENGKLDLTRAEAIGDLIHAETEAQKAQALSQMEGHLADLYDGWRDKLIRILAHLEADLDFPDEDLPEGVSQEAIKAIGALSSAIDDHLNDNRRGERLRDGFHVVVIGAPNAGKSSLVNALAQRDVAIVSDIAGTTRDIVEVHLNIGGFPVILSDTAGLRPDQIGQEGHDAIEGEGIRRALQRAEMADIRILLFDGPEEVPDKHTMALMNKEAIVAFNKCDLVKPCIDGMDGALYLSTKTGLGLGQLTETIREKICALVGTSQTPSLTRERHRIALQECLNCLDRSCAAVLPELMAEDIRLAVRALGRITGRVDVEDLLDIIFRDFCIGK